MNNEQYCSSIWQMGIAKLSLAPDASSACVVTAVAELWCWPPACARIISSRLTPNKKQEGDVLPIISENIKVDRQNIY